MDLILILILLSFLLPPLVFTLINLIGAIEVCFRKKRLKRLRKMLPTNDFFTLVLGFLFSAMVLCSYPEYDEVIVYGIGLPKVHTPIAWKYALWPAAAALLCTAAFFLLSYYGNRTPPLLTVLLFGIEGVGVVLSVVYLIQLSAHLDFFTGYLMLYPINYLMMVFRLSLNWLREYLERQPEEEKAYPDFVRKKLFHLLKAGMKQAGILLAIALPILLLAALILTLFGQRPDGIILAFTETSDWTLSQQISPPPVTADNHYLCTVSLRGHRKLVKPVRYGIRGEERIVVNRQLMIANAFEDLLAERLPRFHHFVRWVYDRYGYPISRHINSKWSADFVYCLMKPLEWIFLAVLYLFDRFPENRISVQYLPMKKKMLTSLKTDFNKGLSRH